LRQPFTAWKTALVLRAYRRAQENFRLEKGHGTAHLRIQHIARDTGYGELLVNDSINHWMATVPLPTVAKARFRDIEAFCLWARTNSLALAVLSDYDPRRELAAL
jgi:hypothetical protein